MVKQCTNNLMKLWIGAEGFPSPWPSTKYCAKGKIRYSEEYCFSSLGLLLYLISLHVISFCWCSQIISVEKSKVFCSDVWCCALLDLRMIHEFFCIYKMPLLWFVMIYNLNTSGFRDASLSTFTVDCYCFRKQPLTVLEQQMLIF